MYSFTWEKKTTIKTNHTNIEHSPSSRGVRIVRLGGRGMKLELRLLWRH